MHAYLLICFGKRAGSSINISIHISWHHHRHHPSCKILNYNKIVRSRENIHGYHSGTRKWHSWFLLLRCAKRKSSYHGCGCWSIQTHEVKCDYDAGKVNKVMPKLRELALQSEKIRTPNAESCNITYCTGTPSSGPHSEKLSSKASV